jgi:hypothetical protein
VKCSALDPQSDLAGSICPAWTAGKPGLTGGMKGAHRGSKKLSGVHAAVPQTQIICLKGCRVWPGPFPCPLVVATRLTDYAEQLVQSSFPTSTLGTPTGPRLQLPGTGLLGQPGKIQLRTSSQPCHTGLAHEGPSCP